MNKKISTTDLILSAFMVFYVVWKMPIVALYTNTYIAMGLLVLFTIYVFFTLDIVSRFPVLFVAMTLYLLLMVLDIFSTGRNILNSFWALFLDLFPIFIGYILIREKNTTVISVTMWAFIITYAITALTTIIGLQSDPMASRILATAGANYEKYYSRNIGGFGFIYILSLTHPLFIAFLRKRKHLLICIGYSILCGICVFASSYTYAALAFISSCIAYIFPVAKGKKLSKKTLALLIAGMLLAVSFAPAILRSISQWDALDMSSEKLEDLANMLEGKETNHEDTDMRIMFYTRSWETFLKSPIWGGKLTGSRSGGHSAILDIMADWGIIGLSALAFIYVECYKFYKRLSKSGNSFYFSTLTFVIAVVLALLNPYIFTLALGITIPFTIYLFEDGESGTTLSNPRKIS